MCERSDCEEVYYTTKSIMTMESIYDGYGVIVDSMVSYVRGGTIKRCAGCGKVLKGKQNKQLKKES